MTSLQAGTKLGPYEILSQIGAGGMGEVYRARDPRVGRDVAVKVSSEQFTDRFSREVHAVAALNHPNIATLYDVGPNYLVMELVEGPTLAEHIRQGAIPLEESLGIARQIADALEAAHEKGIVHRDLKPGNIKVRPDGTVKVLDFGLAKVGETPAVSSEDSPTLSVAQTAAGVILGTAAYMSPEQARGKIVDKRADIWAFGVVLYEMLTGRQLFTGETVSDTLAAVLTREPEWEKLPAKVRPVLRRCLERDPKKRLRDIGDAMPLREGLPESTPARSPWLAWTLAAALFIAFLLLAGSRFLEKPSAPGAPVRSQIALPEKVTIDPSDSFSLSPDGRHLAFTAAGPDGVMRLWIRALDSLQARPVPGTESNWIPIFFWSSDSRFIAFNSGGKLKKIDIAGGAPQTICDLSMSAFGGSWSRDGLIIFGTGPAGIMRVPASGGVASALSKLRPDRQEIGHYLPVFLADGRHFIYFCSSTTPGTTGMYVGSLDAKPEEQVVKQLLATSLAAAYVPASNSRQGQLLFLRERTLMSQPFDERRLEVTGDPIPLTEQVGSFAYFAFFSAASNGVLVYRSGEIQPTQATWFDRQGKPLGSAGKSGTIYGLAISPSGAQAAIGLDNTLRGSAISVDLWLVDLLGGSDTRLTFGKNLNSTPAWTPDGNRIIFASDRGGFNDLYQKLTSGAKPEELLFESSETKMPTSCSRDGRFLLYTVADPKTKGDVWILPLQGDRKPTPLLRTENDEIEGRFSPDMRWIAYVSDESGSSEIYVRAFSQPSGGAALEAGAKWMVSQGGGRGPRWRGDSKELYYIAQDGNVMAVEITADEIFRAGTRKALFPAPRKGIIHRDLKPSNIMVTNEGSVKLRDFGLAKLYEQDASISTSPTADFPATQAGAVLGTVAYMSPEQAQGQPADARSDIFSFGLVLYEMLSGRRAFSGNSAPEILAALLRDEPLPLQISSSLEKIVRRCLAKQLSARFQTISEVKAALEHSLEAKATGASAEPQPSIAVLPFVNMSGDKEQEYFSDGLAEEIINALTKIPGLKVPARTSAFAFRGKEQDITRIADALHVGTILEGSVRKSGNRIRISAQLINAADGYHLWSERYDRDMTDVFAIQDEISQAIADKLRVRLSGSSPLVKRYTENVEAYNLCLKGRYHQFRFTADSLSKSKEYYEQAIAIDPNYALAWFGLADFHYLLGGLGFMLPKAANEQCRQAVLRALKFDETLPLAHSMMGTLWALDYDWKAAEHEFLRAIQLGPEELTVWVQYGSYYLVPMRRLDEATAVSRRALTLDPLSPLLLTQLSIRYIFMRQYDQAIEQCRSVLDLDPRFPLAHLWLAIACIQAGKLEEGIQAIETATQISGRNPLCLGALGFAYARAGRIDETRKLLDQLWELAQETYIPAINFGMIYFGLGEIDKSFDWIEKAADQHDGFSLFHYISFIFDPLRSHPRYRSLLRKMNLEP